MRTTIIVCLFYILMAATLTTSCVAKKNPRQIYRDKLLNYVANEMYQYNLTLIGHGGACTSEDKTSKISYTFEFPYQLTIEEGRKLALLVSKEVIDTVNATPDNSKLFVEFPITSKLLDIGIIGPELAEYSENSEYCEIVSLSNNVIRYKVSLPHPKGNGPLKTIKQESYEEVLAIVNEQKANK